MENWVIGTKLVILLYCLIRYILVGMANIPIVLLLILLYVCVDMLHYVVRNTAYKKIIASAACIFLFLSALYINPVFMLLLPINLFGLSGGLRSAADGGNAGGPRYMGIPDLKIWAAIAAAPMLVFNPDFLPEYILSGFLSAIIYVLAARVHSGMARLREENSLLKDRIDALNGKLDVGAEYENQVKYLSQLEERNSLAQKIHDRVGHTLAGSLIQLEAANMIIDRDSAKTKEILENVVTHLKEGMESIRSTLRNIKPAPEQLGVNRLLVMLDEFSMNNPVKASLTYKGSLDTITHLEWKVITDNVKEALTNVLKYSSASTVKVDITVMNKLVRAEVKDNGVGAYTIKKGLGITGMEERTENAGGKLIIDGSSGFSIIMLLPVSEVANADKSVDS